MPLNCINIGPIGSRSWVPGRGRARAALSLSLILHELATNAAKHGALSTAAGQIIIGWQIQSETHEPEVVLSWREVGARCNRTDADGLRHAVDRPRAGRQLRRGGRPRLPADGGDLYDHGAAQWLAGARPGSLANPPRRPDQRHHGCRGIQPTEQCGHSPGNGYRMDAA